MGKTDCFTQFYPILPNWFYPLGKTYMPTLRIPLQGLGIFGPNFTRPLYVPIYARLQIFVQLSPTVTKLIVMPY